MQFRTIILSWLIAIILFGCQDTATKESKNTEPNKELATLLSQYHEKRLKLYPQEATYAGDKRYNDLLHIDISQAHRAKLEAFYEEFQDELAAFEPSELNENDRISFDILSWECAINLEKLTFAEHLMPINQFWSLPLTIGQFASGSSAQPFETVEDYDNWLSRLSIFVQWCDTAIANMDRGIAQGYVLPTSLTKKTIPQMADLSMGPVESHLYYQPIGKMPKRFSKEDKERLTASYRAMVETQIIPAFDRLHKYFVSTYLPASRESAGISAIPNGAAYYQYLIKQYTTTDLTADEVFTIGENEVERISKEMEGVIKEVGFEGDLKAFFDHVRTRPELMPYTDAQEVVDHFNEIHDQMKPNIPKLFDLVPKTPFEVRRTEAFREASASAEYSQGSLDGTRPGIFYVPVPNAEKYNIFSDEDLFLHEAIPGHHYQISLQQENKDLPEFRRAIWYNSYGEGWALYSESLGKELGLYKDPYQYFGMLSAEIHRAIRLVVDAGIHTKGWTRERAIEYSLAHEAESEESIVAEIERYMAIPGQALSYKIGQLKIRELRAKSEKELGDKFDVREFHNQVLRMGCLPLKILEANIDRWIVETK